jgi:hypothetical protein
VPNPLRAWLRYVVPFTLLSLIACAPLLYIALGVAAADKVAVAQQHVRLAWILAATAWACQLLLVAGVAPGVRSVVHGAPLSQWQAFARGFASLVRGLLPCAIAVAAIVLGGLALVVPGLLLLVLLAMTGASRELSAPPPAALVDSVAVARSQLTRVAFVVATIVVCNLAIAYAAHTLLVPTLVKKMAAAKLAPVRTFVRVVALALVALSPIASCTLAARYEQLTRRTH